MLNRFGQCNALKLRDIRYGICYIIGYIISHMSYIIGGVDRPLQ